MHFRERKVLYFDWNVTEVCSYGSNWQYSSIGLDNDLVPNRRQAIIWTNADPIQWRIYAALGRDELTEKHGANQPIMLKHFRNINKIMKTNI